MLFNMMVRDRDEYLSVLYFKLKTRCNDLEWMLVVALGSSIRSQTHALLLLVITLRREHLLCA